MPAGSRGQSYRWRVQHLEVMNTAGIKANSIEDQEWVTDCPKGTCLSEDRVGEPKTEGTLALLLSQAPWEK